MPYPMSSKQRYAVRLIEKYSGKRIGMAHPHTFISENIEEYENAKAVEAIKREMKRDAEKTDERVAI